MDIYTIGFTKKNAETFFNLLRKENIKTLIDIRLNNVSQLAGFAKRDDLKFFLHELCNAKYVHAPELSPTKEILTAYKKGDMSWGTYEREFTKIMTNRHIEKIFDSEQLNNSCLLCSENEPTFCHRRLVAEYLKANVNFNLSIKHLLKK